MGSRLFVDVLFSIPGDWPLIKNFDNPGFHPLEVDLTITSPLTHKKVRQLLKTCIKMVEDLWK